jgi:hypothetical protein
MLTPANRRRFLQTLAAAAAWPAVRGHAEELTGDVKLTMPANLSEESLSFIRQLGVEWVTMGGPAAPTYTPEGRVIPRPNDDATPGGPWTEQQIRDITQRVESFGLKVGNLMLHDFRNVILGRPGRDETSKRFGSRSASPGKPAFPSSNTISTPCGRWADTIAYRVAPASSTPRMTTTAAKTCPYSPTWASIPPRLCGSATPIS